MFSMYSMIPRIIHHQAPANFNEWHPIWEICYKSWKNKFEDFDFQMWDEERCDNFVKENYPQYYDLYIKQSHIIRIDLARYMFLYQYGGIYADMDMYCFKNFYFEIKEPLCLPESPGDDELVTNCLMITSPKHQFFKKCIDTAFKRLQEISSESLQIGSDYTIKYIAGPLLLSDVYREERWFYKISKMPISLFLGLVDDKEIDTNLYTKHFMTGMWGKDTMGNILKLKEEKGCSDLSDKEFLMLCYKSFRKVNYDFSSL